MQFDHVQLGFSTLLLTGNILLKLRGVKAGGGGEESLLKAQNIISKRSL